LDRNERYAWESSGTGGGIQGRLCNEQGEERGGQVFRDDGSLQKGCLYFLYSHSIAVMTIGETVPHAVFSLSVAEIGVAFYPIDLGSLSKTWK